MEARRRLGPSVRTRPQGPKRRVHDTSPEDSGGRRVRADVGAVPPPTAQARPDPRRHRRDLVPGTPDQRPRRGARAAREGRRPASAPISEGLDDEVNVIQPLLLHSAAVSAQVGCDCETAGQRSRKGMPKQLVDDSCSAGCVVGAQDCFEQGWIIAEGCGHRRHPCVRPGPVPAFVMARECA